MWGWGRWSRRRTFCRTRADRTLEMRLILCRNLFNLISLLSYKLQRLHVWDCTAWTNVKYFCRYLLRRNSNHILAILVLHLFLITWDFIIWFSFVRPATHLAQLQVKISGELCQNSHHSPLILMCLERTQCDMCSIQWKCILQHIGMCQASTNIPPIPFHLSISIR